MKAGAKLALKFLCRILMMTIIWARCWV